MTRQISRLTALTLLAVPAILAGGGCRDAAKPSNLVEYYDRSPAVGFMALDRSPAARDQLEARLAAGAESSRGLPRVDRADAAANLLIRSGDVRLEVDSLEPAVAQVHALVERLGGYVGGTATQMGRGDIRSATIALKVPAERFDEALSGVRPIGDVESVDISTQDVTEEYVDVGARTENARRLERRLAQILATRTGALKDVLEVEQALARVREEIERYEGRLRYLREHAAMSSLTVHLHEPAPLVGHAGGSVLGTALDQAWANFVRLVVVLVQALGFVVPLGALAGAGWIGVRRFRHHAVT